MTPRQLKYVQNRASGLGQEQSAIKAGYARGSAKVIASRMERNPAIKAAIEAARTSTADSRGKAEYVDAQEYLTAVVRGLATPDPVRVGAARALLPFERARQRAPVKGASPRDLDARDASAEEQRQLAEWEQKTKAVRERISRKRKGA